MSALPKTQFKGKLILELGPMFSGKTTRLIEHYTKHQLAKKRCLIIKHSLDTRYDEECIVAHNKRQVPASISCSSLDVVDEIAGNYDVICIDEIQFFEDAPIFCDKWANQNIVVVASGLSGTFDRKEFPVISKLLPLAEETNFSKAICVETDNDAQFTFRKNDSTETILVGGEDIYKAVDRITYFTENHIPIIEHDLNEFMKYAEIYEKKNNTIIDNKNLKEYFKNNYCNKCYPNILKGYLKTIVSK